MKHIYFIFSRRGAYTTEVLAIVRDPRRDQIYNRIMGRWEVSSFPTRSHDQNFDILRRALRTKKIAWSQE